MRGPDEFAQLIAYLWVAVQDIDNRVCGAHPGSLRAPVEARNEAFAIVTIGCGQRSRYSRRAVAIASAQTNSRGTMADSSCSAGTTSSKWTSDNAPAFAGSATDTTAMLGPSSARVRVA